MDLAMGLKSGFTILGCVITATVIYTVISDGLPFRIELLTPWMAVTLIDFYINTFAIGAWVVYKETSWTFAVLWVALLICWGSITTCSYIVLQLLKLSPKESMQDPIYYVLLRRGKTNRAESNKKFPVGIAKAVFIALGCLMLGALIYTIVTDGSPFRRELYTPWVSATLVDLYISIVVLSVWVSYKESSWISAACWIVLLACLGSFSTCIYVVVQLFRLSSQDPVYYILFKGRNRRLEEGNEETLKEGISVEDT
ncbi:unnamed protein product [Cuscuta epithymum]|uniref:Transmembrane protein n=1 Tax=Cuscuta epithymum TaxID=186058 RepID=A0AAV0DXY6_9ASTE|nr:unnamed protein product [Cuscuta epithymum]